jgi:ATP-dependent Clp protease ATP-binding subunit ClpX
MGVLIQNTTEIRSFNTKKIIEFLIPEFIGRVPVIVTLQSLNRDFLKRILVEPKNSLVRQYKKLFEYDKVELEFEDDALDTITDIALGRKTGARGLRAIMEAVMMDSMYKVPSDNQVVKCIITKDAAEGKCEPTLISSEDNQPRKAIAKRTSKRNSNEIA